MASSSTSASRNQGKGEGAPSQEVILTHNDQCLLCTIKLFRNGPWKEPQDPAEKVEKLKQCHQKNRAGLTKNHKELLKSRREAFQRRSQSQEGQGRVRRSQNIGQDSSQLDSQTDEMLNETTELTKRRRVRIRKFDGRE